MLSLCVLFAGFANLDNANTFYGATYIIIGLSLLSMSFQLLTDDMLEVYQYTLKYLQSCYNPPTPQERLQAYIDEAVAAGKMEPLEVQAARSVEQAKKRREKARQRKKELEAKLKQKLQEDGVADKDKDIEANK